MKIAWGVVIVILLVVGYIYLGELFPETYDRAGFAMVGLASITTIPVYKTPVLDLADHRFDH
ncbi:MAG: hypothetical protein NT041_02390 [Candidatus Vogelbacteria bacterium]|nr:hypothetical protein [Candidatus Vogelbacteria bacterium]